MLWGQGLGLPEDVGHKPDRSRELLTGQRVMQIFDFEERGLHYEEVPMYWKKVRARQGFPHYSYGLLDRAVQHGGEYSFKLMPDGGSVAFEYHPRRIPVMPGSDFQITGYVHIENGESCRAQIRCSLTNRTGQIIEGSTVTSELVGEQDQANDGWAKLSVYVPGNFSEARFITVGVWFLQQEQWNLEGVSDGRVFQKNVDAVAWFDDISVFQLPRVILQTEKKGNVFQHDEPVQLQVEMEGVGVLDYHVELKVHTADGRLIYREPWVLTGVEGEKNIRQIDLPGLPAGAYRAQMDIMSTDVLVASRHLTFARLAPLSRDAHNGGKGFGIILREEKYPDWELAMELIRILNVKQLKLPVWRRHANMEGAIVSEKDFDRYLINMQRHNIQVVAMFNEVPDALAHKLDVGRRGLLDVLSQRAEFWRPHVASLLSQYARQIAFWQIGGDYSDGRVWDPRIQTILESLRQEFSRLVRNTVLTAPLDSMADISRPQVGTDYAALQLPTAINPDQIPAYLSGSRQRGFEHLWVTIDRLDRSLYDREQVLIDMALRIAFAKKGQAEGIFIDHPWQQRKYNARLVTEPSEEFLVFRTMADYLGGARYVGSYEVGDGVTAMIFDHGGKGSLFLWNREYDPLSRKAPEEIELYLGDEPVLVDLLGNRKALDANNGLGRIRLDQWPKLVSGIDTRIAQLRASLHLEPEKIEASIVRQRLRLKFTNPFHVTVSGQIRFLLEGGGYRNWVIEPSVMNFILNQGEEFNEEISLKLPTNEVGGMKELAAYLTLEANRNYGLHVSVPFEIQLFGIDMNVFTQRINGSDLLIQQVVTNESEEEISLISFVDLPDRDHLERAIPRLQPGVSVTKSYLIRDAQKWVGQYVRIGLNDPKGTRRINHLVLIN